MNEKRAQQFYKILTSKGYHVECVRDSQGTCLVVLADEGQDTEIRNAIPVWMWFVYGLRTQTLHEHRGSIQVFINTRR